MAASIQKAANYFEGDTVMKRWFIFGIIIPLLWSIGGSLISHFMGTDPIKGDTIYIMYLIGFMTSQIFDYIDKSKDKEDK